MPNGFINGSNPHMRISAKRDLNKAIKGSNPCTHRIGSRSPNFQGYTPQTHNHSRGHQGGWAKPSSGPSSWSLSSSQSGCSIVMGVCYQCAATGLPGDQCITCGSMFQAKGGTHPAEGTTHFPPHLQSHIFHQVLAAPPALSARVELPCAPPSTMNAPPFHPPQAEYTHDLSVSGAVAGGAGGFSGYSAGSNPVHTSRQSVSAPLFNF